MQNECSFSFFIYLAYNSFCFVTCFSANIQVHNAELNASRTANLLSEWNRVPLPGSNAKPPHLPGQNCSLHSLFAPYLVIGKITFLGHFSEKKKKCDLIFPSWPGPCHPNMRRSNKLKSDTYWNETPILRRNSDLFSLTLELELNL